jgi:hypothetical protein
MASLSPACGEAPKQYIENTENRASNKLFVLLFKTTSPNADAPDE